MRNKSKAMCVLAAMNVLLCSCSKPQPESGSGSSAAESGSYSEMGGAAGGTSDSAGLQDGTSEVGNAERFIDGLPVLEIKTFPEQPNPEKNPEMPGDYVEYNGKKFLYNFINFCESKDDESNWNLIVAAACAEQDQITEYSQWYDYVSSLEPVGYLETYYFPDDGSDKGINVTTKLYNSDDKCLIEEYSAENGDRVYWLWGGKLE